MGTTPAMLITDPVAVLATGISWASVMAMLWTMHHFLERRVNPAPVSNIMYPLVSLEDSFLSYSVAEGLAPAADHLDYLVARTATSMCGCSS